MIEAAIRETPISDIKDITHDGERGSLQLDLRGEVHALELSHQLYVDRPAWINIARVQIKRENELFLSHAVIGRGHCIEKERARVKVDNGCAGDAHWVNDSGTREIVLRQRHAKIALPNDAPIHSVKRVYIIRFGYRNDHWAACAALDVKRLRVNVTYDRTVEVQVARQVRGSR